jgi:hypothetical protein
MALTKRLLRWLGSLFRGRSRLVVAVVVVLFVLFGWLLALLALGVTVVADLVGLGPGARLPAWSRLTAGVLVVFVAIGLTGNAGKATSTSATPSPGAVAQVASSQPSHSPSLTPAASGTPTSPPTAQPTPVPASPTPIPVAITVTDPKGDLVDENDEPASGPAYQDITKVAVEARAGRLQLDTWVAAAPPKRDPLYEDITFGWWIDTNGDGDPDYQLLVDNDNIESEQTAPGWTASLFDVAATHAQSGKDFPGTLVVKGSQVTVRVFLFALQFPSNVQVFALTESDTWADPVNDPTNDVLRHDYVPQHTWPDGSEWIRVSVGS